MRGKKARALRKAVYGDKHHKYTRESVTVKIPWCSFLAGMILGGELRDGYQKVKKHFKKGVIVSG